MSTPVVAESAMTSVDDCREVFTRCKGKQVVLIRSARNNYGDKQPVIRAVRVTMIVDCQRAGAIRRPLASQPVTHSVCTISELCRPFDGERQAE